MSHADPAPSPLPRLRLSVSVTTIPATSLPATTSDAGFVRDARLRAGAAPHVILCGDGDHPCARRSFAAFAPALLLLVKNGVTIVRSARGDRTGSGNPFDLLDALLHGIVRTDGTTDGNPDTGRSVDVPLCAGMVAYEAGRYIEALPARAEDRLGLPDVFFLFPTAVRMLDRATGRVRNAALCWEDDEGPLPPLAAVDAGTTSTPATMIDGPLVRGFTRARYIEAVERVRRHIRDGDVYQVNLSQRFNAPLDGDPFALWLRMIARNPVPFSAWVDGGNYQLLSASMERFFRIERGDGAGDRIETRPIKGTRPRGRDDAETAQLAEELLRSEKDAAELAMIVDLERNDLGKVCQTGSVRVAAHGMIERYADVQHLVSIVEGRLRNGTRIGEVFDALFPGGSITGCPKIRAMEIIDTLEPETRHAYTGAIGYITTDGAADFNIAIRTAIATRGRIHYSVGGGIVCDSDPAAEYLETLHKGRTFFELAHIRTELDERT
ncbi:MAG: aminodeoxychorismate synthase component I [Bacteroidota bacterium]|nr:aminodeoxychorismate synthase component I [Bacteroidota bacterium]